MKKLIAFAGRKKSGKNTAADIIRDMYPKQGIIYFAFADILKDIAQKSLRITGEQAEVLKTMTSAKVANGLDLREFYNTMGDAIKDNFGYDIWAKHTLASLAEVMTDADMAVCTDVRYPIEVEELKKFCLGYDIELTIIKMNNLNHTQRRDNEHESEYLTDRLEVDFTIDAWNPKEIKEQLVEIMKEGIIDAV